MKIKTFDQCKDGEYFCLVAYANDAGLRIDRLLRIIKQNNCTVMPLGEKLIVGYEDYLSALNKERTRQLEVMARRKAAAKTRADINRSNAELIASMGASAVSEQLAKQEEEKKKVQNEGK